MTARNEDDRRDADYDGMDALMAALVGDPLPEGALRDPAFMTAHRAATADVALLREQLLLMGDTLARDTGADVAGPEPGSRTRAEAVAPAEGAPATRPTDGPRAAHAGGPGPAVGSSPDPADPAGQAPAAGSAGAAPRVHAGGSGTVADPSAEEGGRADGLRVVPAGAPGGAADPEAGARDRAEGEQRAAGAPAGASPVRVGEPGPEVEGRAGRDVEDGTRGAHAGGPGVGGDPSVRVLPVGRRAAGGLSGRRGRPRAAGVVLRGVVAAVAATVVVGLGWLVVRGAHESADDASSGSAADAAAGPARGEEGAKVGHAGYLACARIVAEGTVAEVEPVPGTGQDRVTLDVDRSYKPAKGQDRIVFPLDEDVDPLLRPGDHVLVGITRGQAQPDLWSVGEKEIARARAWITAALPESANLPCE